MLGVRFSPDGRWLAALAEFGSVYLFDVSKNYKQVARLSLRASYVFVLKWSANSKRLFVGTREGYLNVWNVRTKSCSP